MEKNKILGLVIILLLIPLFYFGYQIYSGELQFKTVLSGSMSPTINAGDAILISGIDPEEIKEQDIITFKEGETFTTHRVIEIVNNTFRTKGDANEDPDTKLVKTDQIVGKLVFTIPFLGYFGHFIRTIPGFLIFILIPGILIIYSEIKKIKTEIRAKPKYEVNKIEKGEIISKLRKQIFNYNKSLKKTLGIYLIFAFLLVFLFPFYTGGFFSDTGLSTNNLFKAANCFKGNSCNGDCVEVNLNSPANNILTNDSNPDFEFTATSDINKTFPCELFIDDTGYGANDSVSNNTATIITANSSLSNGTYNWYINCTDVDGTFKSEEREIIIDTTNPEISYNSNTTDESGNYSRDWLFINVTASDKNKDTVKLYWNENEEEFENQSGDIYWTNKTNLTNGNYSFYALVKDKAGNSNQTEPREIEILTSCTGGCGGGGNGGTGGDNEENDTETSDFSINLTYPTNNSYTNKNTTEFNFTVSGTENNYSCELFLKNQTGNWTGYGLNNSVKNNSQTTIIPNLTENQTLSEGVYKWFIHCTSNKITTLSETRNLTIDKTAPTVNLMNKSFSTNKSQPEIYFNFTDVLSPNASCVLYFNNSAVGNNSSVTKNITTSLIPNSTQPDGNYTVYVNCTDLAGNTNKSGEINVSIDAPPTTKATAIKENGEIYSFGEWTNSRYVNVTLNCSAPDCNTTLYCIGNNSCEPNLTYNGTPIQISAENISYIRFRSNDSVGNNESIKKETIKIDWTKPLIQITSPNSNSSLNSSLIEINLTVTEDNLNYTNISIYNQTGDLVNSTTNNRTGNYTFNLSVPDGIYNITATVYDLAGNQNLTGVENITIDTTPPKILNPKINNTSIPINSSVKLYTTITDFVGVDTVIFNITTPYRNLTLNATKGTNNEYFIICNSTNECKTNQTGVYNWTEIWANDTPGNSNSTDLSLHFNVTGGT